MLYCCIVSAPAKAAPAIATQPAPMHRKPGETLMLLVAQAACEQIPLVSVDTALDAYTATPLW